MSAFADAELPQTKTPIIPFEESLLDLGERVQHNAHCFLFARTDLILTGLDKKKDHELPVRAIILMHLRFDGYFGFPGGIVDKPVAGLAPLQAQSEIIDAVNRELEEEISYDCEQYPITWGNYIMTQQSINTLTNGINYLHFFGKEVPESYIPILEEDSIKNARRGYEYGREVLGNVRVPLYTLTDGVRGFPAFLSNNFIGIAKEQLVVGIVKFNILTKHEVNEALGKGKAAK